MATLYNTKISATYEGLLKTIDNAAITATLKELTDGSGNQSGLYLNTAGDFKVTSILEWGSLKDTGTGVTITQFVTSTDGIENFDNNTTLPTSAAVKLYVDTKFSQTDTLQEVLGFGNTTSGTDIAVSAGDDITFTDSSKIILGTSSEFEIFQDTADSRITTLSNLYIQTPQFRLQKVGGEQMITAISDAQVELYYNNSKRLETTIDGSKVTGNLVVTGTITGSGGSFLPLAGGTMTGDIVLNDNVKSIYGTASDGLEIYHNGSNSYIKDSGTGTLNIQGSTQVLIGGANGQIGVQYIEGVDVKLRHANVTKLSTTSTGVSITGALTTTTDVSVGANATFVDGGKALFGASSDLQIYHDGSHSYIKDSGTGVLKIQGSGLTVQNSAGSENIATFTENGSVGLYYDAIKRIETVTAGAKVTGDLEVTGTITGSGGSFLPLIGGTMVGNTIHNDGVKSIYGTSGDGLEIFHDGVASYIVDTGTGTLNVRGSTQVNIGGANGTIGFQTVEGANSSMRHNNVTKLTTSNTGISVTGDVDATGNGDFLGNVTVGAANTELSEGHLRFNFNGGAYIDQATVTQSIYFRTSDANSLDTTALIINRSGDLITGRDVTIAGDLTVNGTTTTVNSQTLSVDDPLISLAINNSANSLDIGYYGKYNDGTTRYLGLFNDASDSNKFKLFRGTTVEPTTTVNIGGAGYVAADLVVAALEATTGTFTGTGTFGGAVRINGTTTTGLVIASSAAASNGLKLYNNSTTDNAYIYNHYSGNLEIGTNNATVLTMNGTSSTFAGDIMPNAENLYDIGSASVRWEDIWADQVYGRSVYVDDNIYHNGDTDTYIAFPAANEFKLVAGGNNIIAGDINAAYLYYQGGVKLQTTSTGVSVSGDLTFATSSNETIKSDGSLRINIDTNNDQTDRVFILSRGSNTEMMRVDESGNGSFAGQVGVGGAPTAGYNLDSVQDVGGYSIVGRHSSGGKVGIYNSTGDNGIGTINNYPMNFFTNNSAPQVTLLQSGNVGIGTTTPTVALDVLGASNTSSRARFTKGVQTLQFGAARDTSTVPFIGSETNHDFSIITNDTERMRIDASGNVGIGTTSPSAKLNVVTDDAVTNDSTNVLNITHTSTGTTANGFGAGLGFFIENSTYGVISEVGRIEVIETDQTAFDDDMLFYTKGNNTLAERMRIDSTGKVGIGTAPSKLLTVSQAVQGDIALFTNTTDADLHINLTSGVTLLTPSTNVLAFGTSNTERMRIDSAGNVLISAVNGITPTKLQVFGSDMPDTGDAPGVEDILNLYRYGSNTVWAGGATLALGRYATGGSAPFSRLDFKLKDAAGSNTALPETTVMTMQSNGNVGIGTTNPSELLTLGNATAGTNVTMAINGVENKAARIYFQQSGTTKWSLGNGAASEDNKFAIYNGVTGRHAMVVDNATDNIFLAKDGGNVGIGTTNPGRALDVVGAIQAQGLFKSLVSSSSTNLATSNGGSLNLTNSSATDGNFSNIGGYNSNSLVTSQINFINVSHASRTGDISFNTHNGTGLIERMRITSAGKVGIMKNTPTTALDVNGIIRQSGSNHYEDIIQKSGDTGSYTFTYQELSGNMADNISYFIFVSVYRPSIDIANDVGTLLLHGIMPRGGASVFNTISTIKGSGISVLTATNSANSLVITTDSGTTLRCELKVIAMGGTS